jgi:hypothetical protein
MRHKPSKPNQATKPRQTAQSNRKEKDPMDNTPAPESSDALEESEEVVWLETAAVDLQTTEQQQEQPTTLAVAPPPTVAAVVPTPTPAPTPTPVPPLDSMQQAALAMASADAAGRLAEQAVANAANGLTQASTSTPPTTTPVEGLD